MLGAGIMDGISRSCNSVPCRGPEERLDGSAEIPHNIKICAVV
jgi:hypothetical protein